MGCFIADFEFEPDQHSEFPFTKWMFGITFNCVEERGGAPGLHISDIGLDAENTYGKRKGVELRRTSLACGPHDAGLVLTTLDYDEAVEAWFRAELRRPSVEAIVRKACGRFYRELTSDFRTDQIIAAELWSE